MRMATMAATIGVLSTAAEADWRAELRLERALDTWLEMDETLMVIVVDVPVIVVMLGATEVVDELVDELVELVELVDELVEAATMAIRARRATMKSLNCMAGLGASVRYLTAGCRACVGVARVPLKPATRPPL